MSESKFSVIKQFVTWYYVLPGLLLGALISYVLYTQNAPLRERRMEEKLKAYQSEMKRMQQEIDEMHRELDTIQKHDEDIYRLVLFKDSFPMKLRKRGNHVDLRLKLGYSPTEEHFHLKSTEQKIQAIKSYMRGRKNSMKELALMARNLIQVYLSVPAISPIGSKTPVYMSSEYGTRIDPVDSVEKFHYGLDFNAPIGAPVLATGSGYVESTEKSEEGYGFHIVINHGYGYKTRYAHLSRFKVKAGQYVERGQTIGAVGSTGKSTGPHLHYEVERYGEKVDPKYYFASRWKPNVYHQLLGVKKKSFKSLFG